MKRIKQRDFHKLAILRGEANGRTSVVPDKKAFNKKIKHKKISYV